MDAPERGQVAPLLALFAVGAGLAALGLGRFGADAVDHARARTAADAAALAAAAASGGDGEAAARRSAAANGAAVDSYEAAGADVRVRVTAGAGTASARARASGTTGTAATSPPGLAPALRAALARATQVLGEPVPVTSGFRSPADQRRLWAGRAGNRYPVAPPGTSMHERGLAIDVPLPLAERLAGLSDRTGLCRPYPTSDPVHFELCRPPAPDRRLPRGHPG